MNKKYKRGRLKPFKPQPAICSCDQEKLCEELKDLRIRLDAFKDKAEHYKRLYTSIFEDEIKITHKIVELGQAKREAEAKLTTAKAELNHYRHAFNVIKIINIIFSVGFAVSAAILIWR